MKKTLSALAIALLMGIAPGCVEDSQNVLLDAVMQDGACSSSGSDQQSFAGITCDPSSGGAGYLAVHVVNNITGATPWSGSGGGSGTTFQTTPPNQGLIFLDKIIMSCKSVGGEKDACKGKDKIEVEVNTPISGSGGGACQSFTFDIAKISAWGTGTVNADVYAKYHDSSHIKGETSHTQIVFNLKSGEGSCELLMLPGGGGDEEDSGE